MKLTNLFIAILFFLLFFGCGDQTNERKNQLVDYPIHGVPFNEVHINDQFWLPKIETNRKNTIPASFQKCEEMGRMDNFLIAGGKMEGTVKGEMPFDDTDVYKIIEGAAYSLTTFPDPKLDAYLDSIINMIAIGQEDDGYLTTWKTIDPNHSPAEWCPPGERWEGLAWSHELYNSGHMFEAAAAHYRATGKTNFLDIALKNANLLVEVFGIEDTSKVPGHQIVETGLIKLYSITNEKKYLDLARHFLDTRGDSTIRETWGPYNQDHKPVIEQDEAVGHAVRAAYMYAGMTDIAALYKDEAYKNAIDKIWENVVYKKMYLTGGIGSLHKGEAFGENYELPNLTAYNETCAAIANVYWNYRMFLLYGDAKYMDVLERSLYNGVISGVSLDGTKFFYPNPLSCDMNYHFNSGGSLTREPWFDCSCCPSNLCRFMPSVPGYIYASKAKGLYVNLFIQSSSNIQLKNTSVAIQQETNYPWLGDVKLIVTPEIEKEFSVRLRIPGWASNKPVPGDLYSYTINSEAKEEILVNGNPVTYDVEKGYAVINRKWKKGDKINYHLPMEIKKVRGNQNIKDDLGKLALERGPIVYCVEGSDNLNIDELGISENTKFTSSFSKDLLNGVETIQAIGDTKNETFTAIPYYVWNNRGANKMEVWLPEK